jgi:hypothetical protein
MQSYIPTCIIINALQMYIIIFHFYNFSFFMTYQMTMRDTCQISHTLFTVNANQQFLSFN